MMNYVAQPTVEAIQILLIISNVLSYNMNAGASYTLLGGVFSILFANEEKLTIDRNDGANVLGSWSPC